MKDLRTFSISKY